MRRKQKRRMVIFTVVVVLAFGIGMLAGAGFTRVMDAQAALEAEDKVYAEVMEEAEEYIEEAAEAYMEEEPEAESAPEEPEENLPDDWNLILVNKTHPVPDDYEVELVEIGSGHKVDARIYDDYKAMIKAAKAEGVYVYVTSSYRDTIKQTQLHDNKIEEYVTEGYSYAEAQELAGQVVAVPGTSEHQLGLALDFVSSEYRKLDEKQETTKGFQWLKEHCAEYGFILRYPNGKTDITGIIYEPWHFRYVGKEAAKEIMETGVTLEEYLGAAPFSYFTQR